MLSALLGLLGAGLLVIPAVLVPAMLGVTDRATFLVAALVSASGAIVVATIGLSLLDAYGRGGLLVAQLLIAAATVGGWIGAGRPRPPSLPRPSRPAVFAAVRGHAALAFLGGVLAVALALELVLLIVVAPNNWDSMTYHLARIAYWLQEQSVLHFTNGTARQLAQPPNGEFLQGWALAVTDSDHLAQAVQWLALLGLIPAIAGMARAIGYSRPASAFAAGLFALLPQPVLQATTTQNDLIVAFFVVACALLGWRGLRDRHGGELALAAMALGLAVGAKGTALLALPALALIFAVVIARARPPRRVLGVAAGCAVGGLVTLGSFNYVLNTDTYSEPFGPISDAVERVSPLGDNVVRTAWSFVDLPDMEIEWFDSLLSKPAYRIFGDLRSSTFPGYTADHAVHEDASAFGAVGFLLLPPLLAGTLLLPRVRLERRAIAAAALLFIVLVAVFNEQNPWIGRLFMPAVALAAPLLAWLYEHEWLRTLALVCALAGLVPSLLTNASKPVLTPPKTRTVFSYDRVEQQTLPRPEVGAALLSLDRLVPRDATIGLVRGGDSWDYVFFGPELARRVVPLKRISDAPRALRGLRPAGVVFANARPPSGVRRRSLGGDYWLVPARELSRLAGLRPSR